MIYGTKASPGATELIDQYASDIQAEVCDEVDEQKLSW